MADRTIPLPETPGSPYRLGRSVRHDPRSLRYLVPATATPQTVRWERRIPVLDQGDLGSCTGNAAVGALGTEPLYSALTPVQRQSLDEAAAVRIYSLATELDPFDGTYPPTDTGSDGLDAAKAAVKLGYLSGYQHITSLGAAHTAIQAGPFIVGTTWHEGMFTPDPSGVVHPTGAVAGGHEYECCGYDLDTDLWWFWNSWGSGWSKAGAFALSSADFAALLADQGDATVLVPVTQPAPEPSPVPTDTFPADTYEAFRAHPFSIPKRRAFVAACDRWLGR